MLGLGVVATLAGCGGTGAPVPGLAAKSPAQILAAASSAAQGAATVHVAGSILDGSTPISLNMELVADMGGIGQIALGGLQVRLVELDKLLYVSGNLALYERVAGPAAARRLEGAWLRGPARSRALAPFSTLANPRKLLDLLLAAHGRLSRAPASLIRGQRALGVRDMSSQGTLYVAATGTPYPLEIRWQRGGELEFDDWNGAAEIQAPRHEVSIRELASAG